MIGDSQTRLKFREGIRVGDVFCEKLVHYQFTISDIVGKNHSRRTNSCNINISSSGLYKVVYRVSGAGEIYTLETRGSIVSVRYVSETVFEKSLSYPKSELLEGTDGYWCDYYRNDRKILEMYLERYFKELTKEQIREFKLKNIIEI